MQARPAIVAGACAGLALALWSCAGAVAPEDRPPPQARPAPPGSPKTAAAPAMGTATGAAPSPATPPPAPAAPAPPPPGTLQVTPEGSTTPQRLPFEIVVRDDGRGALVVADEAGGAQVRRIDDRGVGPVVPLAGHRVVGSYGAPRHPTLVTRRGDALCVGQLDRMADAKCHPRRADFVVEVGGRLGWLEERLVVEEEDDAAKPAKKAKPKTRAKRRPKARRRARARRRRGRRPPPPRARKPKPKPIKRKPAWSKVQLFTQWLKADGSLDGEPVDSGLTIVRPLAGMGVLEAVGASDGVLLLHHAHLPPKRDGKRMIPQAATRLSRLDPSGKWAGTRPIELWRGNRGYGFVEGHRKPRLVVRGRHAAYVGRFVKKEGRRTSFGWEAKVLRPLAPVQVGRAVAEVDPWRLASTKPIRARERAGLDAILRHAPRLVAHQTISDAGRVAWVGDTGYYQRNGHFYATDRAGTEKALLHPFVARRPVAAPPDPFAQQARIGEATWTLASVPGGEGGVALARNGAPGPVAATLHARHTAVVGGATGLVIGSPHPPGSGLRVWTVADDGSLKARARPATRIAGALVGVKRKAGGALVAGHTAGAIPSPVVLAAVDASGKLLDEHRSSLRRVAAMWPRPGGGAWLHDGRRVAWVDDAGREIALRAWPVGRGGALCARGRAPRLWQPQVAPGVFGHYPALDGFCAEGSIETAADGALSWRGSRPKGLTQATARLRLSAKARTKRDGPLGQRTTLPTALPAASKRRAKRRCPADMVAIQGGAYCIDRYEGQLTDAATGLPLSPHHPPSPKLTGQVLAAWAFGRRRTGDARARAMPLPPLWRAPKASPKARARSRPGVAPSGYLSSYAAERACKAAGKRLCTRSEFVTACRGQENRPFPYGDDYEQGVCNVFRYAHPAAILHGNSSLGHLDPRLNLVHAQGRPLRRLTGATPRCASRWGDDAVYDLVGNMDEWVAKKGGAFAGAFYARSSRDGCKALISAHPRRYLDYSLGVRCCLTPGGTR